MAANGIRVVEFNPVNPLVHNPKIWRLNNRDHRKLLIVDGSIVFVGGINISNAYSSGSFLRHSAKTGSSSMAGWRDTHVEIAGPVAAEFQKLFLDTWQKQGGTPLARRDYFPQLRKQGNEIVPDKQLIAALIGAAQRGVDVKLILPSHSDSWEAILPIKWKPCLAKTLNNPTGLIWRNGSTGRLLRVSRNGYPGCLHTGYKGIHVRVRRFRMNPTYVSAQILRWIPHVRYAGTY